MLAGHEDHIAQLALIIRGLNAVLWTLLIRRIVMEDKPVSPLARRVISGVLFFGMWVLVIGALVQFGFPSDMARTVYTAFTAFAGISALAMLTTKT